MISGVNPRSYKWRHESSVTLLKALSRQGWAFVAEKGV